MRDFAFPEKTFMCPPPKKVITKGRKKGKAVAKSSTKRNPSFFEHVDTFVASTCASKKSTNPSVQKKSTVSSSMSDAPKPKRGRPKKQIQSPSQESPIPYMD